MCHLCETQKLCERIERQVKNIDAGGAISVDAVREILASAHDDLVRYRAAAAASSLILHGFAVAQVVVEVGDLPGGGGPHGGGLH